MAAYAIFDVDVHDAEQYGEYRQLATPTIAQYGGRYLVRGGEASTLEGDWQPKRIVVLEFDSLEQARAWYDSPRISGRESRSRAYRSKQSDIRAGRLGG